MEIFELYNKDGKKLNKTMIRGQKNLPGEYHKVVHIWFKRSNGDYLIQQRNKASDQYPYQWAPTAGAINIGESIEHAAIRETKEEIGIDISLNELIHIGQYAVETDIANYIVEQFLVLKEIDLDDVQIDPIEVRQVMYASFETIEQMAKNHQFWDYSLIDENYLTLLERRTV